MAETTEQYKARIAQIKSSIVNEPYIKKMRDDIAEGVSKTGNRQADIEDQFKDVIEGTTGKDVISAPEIIAARKGEASLNARLTKNEQETTAQFAQKVGGGKLATMADIGQEIKEAMTGGSVAVVGRNAISTENIIDKQVTADKTDFAESIPSSKNLFDKNEVTPGYRFAIDGSPYEREDYSLSIYYKVNPGDKFDMTAGVDFVEYDEPGNVLKAVRGETTVTTGVNTTHIRHSVYNPHLDTFMLVKNDSLPEIYVPYSQPKVRIKNLEIETDTEKKRFDGKTWNALGDSITNRPNYSYWTILRSKLGFSAVKNYGVSGSSIAVRTDRTDSLVERYPTMIEADVITMLCGTNDFGSGVPLGEMSSRDPSNFYGACHILISGLIEKYPTKIIAVFTTIPRYNMQNKNSQNLYVHDYMDALREVCGFYGVASFDILRNSQLRPYNEANKSTYMPDGLHPNNYGYDLLANQMLPLMKGL